jgi:hypothetical protein
MSVEFRPMRRPCPEPDKDKRTETVPRNALLVGDARELLRRLPTASVDTVITSPPYFALRDYGQPGQLGQEVDVFAWALALPRSSATAVEQTAKQCSSLRR